jgi:hypothetical protein
MIFARNPWVSRAENLVISRFSGVMTIYVY